MGRAPCCDKNGLKKGPWTPEEDLKLINHIQTHGPGNWRTLPKTAGLQRCGKSCRLRWTNYLRPDIKRGRFSFEEEEAIIQLHSILGNKWSAIAARLPGRTDNEIKNYWNTHIRKRLLRSGIDPVTHAPRLDLLDLSSILNSSLSCSNLLGLSSLLSTQALLNPEMLRLASTILSLKNENSDLFSQNIPENMISNGIPQSSPTETPPVQQVQSVPCTASNVPVLDQTQNIQSGFNVGEFPSSGYFNNLSCPASSLATNSLLNDGTSFGPQPNYINCSSTTVPSENMNFNLSSSNSMTNILGINDSITSTPLSSGSNPLNSSSTFINGSTEDERESYCSSFLKFEIPNSCLDISDYI